MWFVKVPEPNGAADSSQWDVEYWLFHQGAAEKLCPLDVLLEARVDTRAITFIVFLNAKKSSCFDSNTETVLEEPGELQFCCIFILLFDSLEKKGSFTSSFSFVLVVLVVYQ